MISFIGMKTRSSGKIRGQQIANAMDANFFDIARLQIQMLDKVVILIRLQNEPLANLLRSRGHIVGYDMLDMPVGDLFFRDKKIDFSSYVNDDAFDFYITNNTYCTSNIANLTESQVYTIPHHSVNFDMKRTCNGQRFENVGYVGLPEQIDNIADIRNVCNDMGLSFNSYNPQTPEDCEDCLGKIDLGVIYLDKTNKLFDAITSIKPNTKLTNFQSFGIPTICSDYKSFREFGEGNYLSVDNIDELKLAFEKMSNKEERIKLSNASYDCSDHYHISQISNMYLRILDEVQ